MTQLITHYTEHTNETTAKTALSQYWLLTETGGDWDRSIVDGPVPVKANDGAGPLINAYFLNIALPTLDITLPGLTGAGYGPADNFTRVYGTAPISPQRTFAQ